MSDDSLATSLAALREKFPEEFTRLFWEAVEAGNTETLSHLIKAGADVDMKDRNGPALHIATTNNDTQTMKVLLDAGANTEAMVNFGETALHKAAWYGYSEATKLLLDYGAATNRGTYLIGNGGFAIADKTPLDIATARKHTNVMALLSGEQLGPNTMGIKDIRTELGLQPPTYTTINEVPDGASARAGAKVRAQEKHVGTPKANAG